MDLSDPVTIEWGVLITTPSGKNAFEPRDSYHGAANDVRHINSARAGTASLVYRERTVGEWTTETTGAEFAVRYRWDDGGEEVEASRGRADAEARVRLASRRPDPQPCVVSRTVEHGQWWVAQAETAH